MKLQVFLLLTAFFITSCKKEEIKVEKKPAETTVITTSPKAEVPTTEEKATPKTFSNTRFREVKAVKINSSEIRVSGQAQIFEARFGWSITDSNGELKTGSEMADSGAPEWGNFDFVIKIPLSKKPLHLSLFENSMKDGSRQYVLDIPVD